MRLLLPSLLILLLSLSIDAQAEAESNCGQSTPIKENFIVDAWQRLKRMVIGGNQVPVGKWPWQVRILFKGADNIYMCGGTLIADRWILTAAHCFEENQPMSVLIGSVTHTGNNTVYPKDYKVHEYYKTPRDESERDTQYLNDIALIELVQPITFDDSASPICLPSRNTTIPEDAHVFATGFGLANDRGNLSIPPQSASPYLLETVFPLMPHDICIKRWNATNPGEILVDTQICGGSHGHGTAEGDSGGPLVMNSKSGRWFQIGITSFGRNEKEHILVQDVVPGVYTNVVKYCDWIEENTGGDAKCHDAELLDATAS